MLIFGVEMVVKIKTKNMAKKTIRLNITDEGVNEFFLKYSLEGQKPGSRMDGEVSIYYLMKDEMFLKRSSDFRALITGDEIHFELKDNYQGSRRSLVNKYLYEVQDHDDMVVKLVLVDFVVEMSTEYKMPQALKNLAQ
jgi:hypothetical protein